MEVCEQISSIGILQASLYAMRRTKRGPNPGTIRAKLRHWKYLFDINSYKCEVSIQEMNWSVQSSVGGFLYHMLEHQT
jgi:hypothetical protein